MDYSGACSSGRVIKGGCAVLRPVIDRRMSLAEAYDPWPRRNLAQHFEQMASVFGDRLVLVTPEVRVTYRELYEEVRTVAKGLIALGVKRRDHVALLLANGAEFLSLALAVSMVGGVVVPLNTMLREDELDYILSHSNSKWLFVHESAGGNDHEKAIMSILSDRETREEPLALQAVVVLPTSEAPIFDGFRSFASFARAADSVSDATLDQIYRASQYPDEIVNIIYTSGTTGLPKGVMLTSDMLLRCAYSSALSRAFDDGRKVFTPLPLYHVFAWVEGLLAVSFVGGCVLTTASFKPSQALAMIDEWQAEDFLCVPTILLALVNEAERSPYNTDSLQALMCAAAPAPVPLWERAVQVLGLSEMCSGYGGTEATAATVHTEVGDPIEKVSTTVGRIKPGGPSGLVEYGNCNSEYKVVDPDTRVTLPAGSVGEFAVRGNFVTRGYYNEPVATAAVFDYDGWFYTGDLGCIDPNDGYLEFHGRAKEVYKVSGENVSPQEVEEVISRYPAVEQAYVVGVPSPVTDETGAAFIELREGQSATRAEIVSWCREHLARFKVPRYYFFLTHEEWPVTGTGKIQKFLLSDIAKERIREEGTQEAHVDA
jgi:fatty-acyl-CoA synthase